MAPSLMRFPVYEGNVARLGLLAAPLPKDIAQFYALSYRLRSHINAVTSGALIFASRPDKVFAVGQYEQTLIEWNAAADKLLERLGQT